mgnify:CR=1 FL=1
MAIARGAGTEIIRSASFEEIEGQGNHTLIHGVQHHIYTVLSVIIHCAGLAATSHFARLLIYGYDSFAGTPTQEIWLWKDTVPEGGTFVWNDKFSFNGVEPTDFAGPMNDATKQDAIADQGQNTAQKLMLQSSDANTKYDVTVTYIDQNNA